MQVRCSHNPAEIRVSTTIHTVTRVRAVAYGFRGLSEIAFSPQCGTMRHMKSPKMHKSIRYPINLIVRVENLAEAETRDFTNMVTVLIQEALDARDAAMAAKRRGR